MQKILKRQLLGCKITLGPRDCVPSADRNRHQEEIRMKEK